MHLQDDEVREFSALWEEEFGEVLSSAEARAHARQLLELYALLAEPPERDLCPFSS